MRGAVSFARHLQRRVGLRHFGRDSFRPVGWEVDENPQGSSATDDGLIRWSDYEVVAPGFDALHIPDPGGDDELVAEVDFGEVVDFVSGDEPHDVVFEQPFAGIAEGIGMEFGSAIEPMEVFGVGDVVDDLAEVILLDVEIEQEWSGVRELVGGHLERGGAREKALRGRLGDHDRFSGFGSAVSAARSGSILRRYFQVYIPVLCPSEKQIRMA